MLRLLAWHRAALRGAAPPIHDGLPECGWYTMRKTKNGPLVPVVIWCDREVDDLGELTGPERLRADVFGDDTDPVTIWTYLTPVSKERHAKVLKWRLENQHIYDDKRAVDLGAAPTIPQGKPR